MQKPGNKELMSLSINSTDSTEEVRQPSSSGRAIVWLLGLALLLLLAGVGYLGNRVLDRLEAVDTRMGELGEEVSTAANEAREARQRAVEAEQSARDAAFLRDLAEEEAEIAWGAATEAEKGAETARREAAAARAEAERARKEAEAELDRLEDALSQIADTRRTALGLVMSLSGDALKFDFDKAEIRPENKELLSRIAGVLLTSKDYTVSANGHTDDVGTQEYNQDLSERRAQAVRDYLVNAGLSEEIFTVQGFGKKQPLVNGTSDAARAKNRRVELGIVNTRIRYPRRHSR